MPAIHPSIHSSVCLYRYIGQLSIHDRILSLKRERRDDCRMWNRIFDFILFHFSSSSSFSYTSWCLFSFKTRQERYPICLDESVNVFVSDVSIRYWNNRRGWNDGAHWQPSRASHQMKNETWEEIGRIIRELYLLGSALLLQIWMVVQSNIMLGMNETLGLKSHCIKFTFILEALSVARTTGWKEGVL